MTEPSFLIAFGIGILSFLSPCILPVLPGYFSYLAGVTQRQDGKRKRTKIFLVSFAFVLGFLLVLIILGATASLAGQFLLKNKTLWQKVGGAIIIIFGMQTLGVLKLNLPAISILDRRFFSDPGSVKTGKSFFAGLSFGFGWTPCIGPILGSILVLASQSQTLEKGIILLTSYALGVSIPLLLSGVFWSRLRFLKNRYVPLISGGTLIILGLLLFFGQYSKLTIWTAQIYQFFKIPIF